MSGRGYPRNNPMPCYPLGFSGLRMAPEDSATLKAIREEEESNFGEWPFFYSPPVPPRKCAARAPFVFGSHQPEPSLTDMISRSLLIPGNTTVVERPQVWSSPLRTRGRANDEKELGYTPAPGAACRAGEAQALLTPLARWARSQGIQAGPGARDKAAVDDGATEGDAMKEAFVSKKRKEAARRLRFDLTAEDAETKGGRRSARKEYPKELYAAADEREEEAANSRPKEEEIEGEEVGILQAEEAADTGCGGGGKVDWGIYALKRAEQNTTDEQAQPKKEATKDDATSPGSVALFPDTLPEAIHI